MSFRWFYLCHYGGARAGYFKMGADKLGVSLFTPVIVHEHLRI